MNNPNAIPRSPSRRYRRHVAWQNDQSRNFCARFTFTYAPSPGIRYTTISLNRRFFVAVKEPPLSDAWQFPGLRVPRMDVSVGSRCMTSAATRAAIGQMDIYPRPTEIRQGEPRNPDQAETGRFPAFRSQAWGLLIKPFGGAVAKTARRSNDVDTTGTGEADLYRALLSPPNNRTAISHNWLVVRSQRLVPKRWANRPTQSIASG